MNSSISITRVKLHDPSRHKTLKQRRCFRQTDRKMRDWRQAGKTGWLEHRQQTERRTDSQMDRKAWLGTDRIGKLVGNRQQTDRQEDRQSDGRTGVIGDMQDRQAGRKTDNRQTCRKTGSHMGGTALLGTGRIDRLVGRQTVRRTGSQFGGKAWLVLQHKAGQEGRGEILLENSFKRWQCYQGK